VLGTSFHPELTQDARVHGFFLKMVRESAEKHVGKQRNVA
jgi:glutamine amidotransferase PdxT